MSTTNPATTQTPAFYELTDTEKRIDRNTDRYFFTTVGASAILALLGCIFFSKVYDINPILGILMIPVLATGILLCVTAGVHKLGADYRTKILAPHLQAATDWLQNTYNLNLNREETQTLILGGSSTVTSPTYTETGDIKRYGTLTIPGYTNGIQFLHNTTHGYQLVDLSNGQELPRKR